MAEQLQAALLHEDLFAARALLLLGDAPLLSEVRRVLRSGGLFVNTFSNRYFPTKVIQGWTKTSEEQHGLLVALYYRRSAQPGLGWDEPVIELRTPPGTPGDPLYAVYARAV